MAFDLQQELTKGVLKLRRQLEAPEALMKRLGALGLASAQKAFRDQALGEHRWPARYEGMEPPVINIAGAISDFNNGRLAPKPNRFQDRPALVDEGQRGGLSGSLTTAASPLTIEWGTNKDYAMLHQKGGSSSVPVTEAGFQRVRKWLFKDAFPFEPRKGREGYVDKLWPPAVRRVHTLRVAPRPFLGITPELAQDMIADVERYFARLDRKTGAN